MQLGMVGLGRMGANMVRRLMHGGHQCAVFDLNPNNVEQLVSEGAIGSTSIDDLVRRLNRPRAVWVMVPAGAPTDETVLGLAARMDSDDIIIDGGMLLHGSGSDGTLFRVRELMAKAARRDPS